MAVRIYLEIGHEASIRTKKTQEGFTHDWEVFVRGCEGAEIHYYVEKVVFYLHDTFPKPKRVVKEPPYSVKESGYAGFNLPIDIYLRNNGEPKKIRFNYDLQLQQSGPAILKVQKEKYVFNTPLEEFKLKLIKGGGTIGSSSNIQEVIDRTSSLDDKNQMTSKPKLSGCSDLMKRQKMRLEEPMRNNFQELFGSPIMTTSKTTLDQKQQVWKDSSKNVSKSDKGNEKAKTKHSPHKEGHKDKEKEKSKDKPESEKKSSKDEKKVKDKQKDRERSKDKSLKKEKSPRPKSPSPPKRAPSPKRSASPARLSSPPVVKHKETKQHDKEKRDKSEDKKGRKRNKEHKESKHVDEQKSEDHKDAKAARPESKKESCKAKSENPPSPTPKVVEKKEKSKEKMSTKELPREERSGEKAHSEKYKSKKKDKEKREKKEEKSHKSEKKPEKTSEPKPNLPVPKTEPKQATPPPQLQPKKEKPSPSSTYTSTVVVDDDSSNSSTSSSASSTPPERFSRLKSESGVKVKEEKNQKLKKEKGYQESAIKCKRKSNSTEDEEPPEKVQKVHNLNNNSDGDQEATGKTCSTKSQGKDESYMSILRGLQHKIMGLKGDKENLLLQRVVKLIADTGKYEVSAHTFDFDLCLLDRSTVQELQELFSSES